MNLGQSPLALNPAVVPVTCAGASSPAMRSPGTAPNAQTMPTPQPSHLLSASKIQRINVWRTEVGASNIVCVCSMRTSPSPPDMTGVGSMSTSARPPTIQASSAASGLANTISTQSQAQRSPTSSLYSTSDVYSSTQATSPLSSNSLGLLLDVEPDMCPQCGVSKNEPLCWEEGEPSMIEGEISNKTKPDKASGTPKKRKLWLGFKKLAGKYTGRDMHQPSVSECKAKNTDSAHLGQMASRGLSRLSLHGHAIPSPADPRQITKESDRVQEITERANVRKHVGQTFKRMSLHLGSPLQTSNPPDLSYRPSTDGVPDAGGAGTQMYSSLRFAAADDKRLMEIIGNNKFAAASPLSRDEGAVVDPDDLEREDRETPEARRLRERAERLEKGRRLLARNGVGPAGKRPVSFAGVGGLAARF